MNGTIEVIGVPFSLGGKKRGSDRGPDALVENGLLTCLSTLGYEVKYQPCESVSKYSEIFPPCDDGGTQIHSFDAVQSVTKLAGARVFACHRLGNFPLILGGDHSISLGTLPQFLDPSICRNRNVGLLWVDAHYDAHTESTTASLYANGLPFAYALGNGEASLACFTHTDDNFSEKKRLHFDTNLALHIGAGDSDCEDEEKTLLEFLSVRNISMQDIHQHGDMSFTLPLEQLLSRVDDLIVTFDLDVMHQNFAPAVSFQSKNGMSPNQAFLIADMIRKSGKLRQLEIVEYNPDFEIQELGVPITAEFVKNFLIHIPGEI